MRAALRLLRAGRVADAAPRREPARAVGDRVPDGDVRELPGVDARGDRPHAASSPSLTTRLDDDYTVTVVDLWAAVADVLTFYQERYANEAFLRTATRRESVCSPRPADRLRAAAGDRGARVARLHRRRRQELPHRPRPARAERPRPGRAAADLRGAGDGGRRLAAQPAADHAGAVRREPAGPRLDSGARRAGPGRAGGGAGARGRRPHRDLRHRLGGPRRGADARRRPLRRGPHRARVARPGAGELGRGLENLEGRPHVPAVRAHGAPVGDGGIDGSDRAGRDQAGP